jgi:hypothetical protein
VPADEATSFFERHAGKGAREEAGIVPDFKLVPGGRAAQLQAKPRGTTMRTNTAETQTASAGRATTLPAIMNHR